MPTQPATADDAPRYDGKIQSLDSPVLLRYQAIGHYRQTCTMAFIAVVESKQQTATMSMTTEGSSHQSDAGLVWDLSSRVDLDSMDPSKVGTVTKGSSVSDDRGRILDFKTSDPDVPSDVVMDIVSELNWQLPANPVSVDDNLTASPISFNMTPLIEKIRRYKGEGGGKIPDLFLNLDLDSIVAGQTIIAGRRYLVVNVDGDGGVTIKGLRIDIEIHGYVFMDVATAIMSNSVLRAEFRVSQGEKSFTMTFDVASATAWD
jgi:hypothetical protein